MSEPEFTVRQARWPEDEPLLKRVREAVFVLEQGVPLALEWDGRDAGALHLLALDPGEKPIGAARLLPDGQIGRMAVLREWRGRGVGRALLERLLALGRQGGYPLPFLNAQTSALEFYLHQGFQPEGDEFTEAAIPHQRMVWSGSRPEEPGGTLFLHSLAEVRATSVGLVQRARRQVLLFSRELDPAIYAQDELVTAIKRLALQTRVASIRILLQDHNLIRSQGHRLIDLAQRLTSTIEVRRPGKEYLEQAENFLVLDDWGYLHQEQADRYDASASFQDRLRSSLLLEQFNTAWETGEPDRELRRLYL